MQGIMVFGLVVLVCASPFLVGIFLQQYFKYKTETASKLAEIELALTQNQNELLQHRVTQLQKRMEVLERIVTDDSYELTQQISSESCLIAS